MAEIDKLTMLKVQLDMRNPPAERITQLEQLLEPRPPGLPNGALPCGIPQMMPSCRWTTPPGCTSGGCCKPAPRCRSTCGWT